MSDGWHLLHDGDDPDKVGLRETLTVPGNGNFCTRGAATDALADGIHRPGTSLAGGAELVHLVDPAERQRRRDGDRTGEPPRDGPGKREGDAP